MFLHRRTFTNHNIGSVTDICCITLIGVLVSLSGVSDSSCKVGQAEGDTGWRIESPNYPQPYPNNVHITISFTK